MAINFIDFLNPIIDTFFQPNIFRYFLLGLAGLSVLAIIFYIIQSVRQNKFTEDERLKLTKYWQDQLKNCRNVNAEFSKSVESLKTQLDNQASQIHPLKLELNNKDDILRKEVLAKEKLWEELKNAESRLEKNHAEQKSLQEVYNGLKEQYADLERQVDTLNQAIALEKTLHERLQEEHAACQKPISP